MAKAILEFDLTDRDDCIEHKRAVKSLDMALVLWEIVHNSRREIEADVERKDCSVWDVVDICFERIHDLLKEHNVNVDELII